MCDLSPYMFSSQSYYSASFDDLRCLLNNMLCGNYVSEVNHE